jgi:predicted ester cyclase
MSAKRTGEQIMSLLKTTGFVLVGALALAGCKKKEEAAPPPQKPATVVEKKMEAPPEEKKEAPKPMTGEELAAFYAQCWSKFNDKDWMAFASCYSPKAICESPTDNFPKATSAEGCVNLAKDHAAAFPDMKGTVDLTLVNGKTALTLAILTGTNTGPMRSPQGEMPPTGKKVGMMMAHVIEFGEDNKAAHTWEYADPATMMFQLGMSPGPARTAMSASTTPAVVAIAKNDDTEKANLAIGDQFIKAFNSHDPKAIAALLAPDYLNSEAGMPMDMPGKETVKMMDEIMKAFSDVNMTIDKTWAAGDYVVQHGNWIGTNDGDMPSMKMKKTGKKVNTPMLAVAQIKGGKVARTWVYWSGVQWASQLGLMPDPKAAPAAAKIDSKAAPTTK